MGTGSVARVTSPLGVCGRMGDDEVASAWYLASQPCDRRPVVLVRQVVIGPGEVRRGGVQRARQGAVLVRRRHQWSPR